MSLRVLAFGIVFIAVSLVAAYQPGEPFKPGKLTPAEVAALQPGLTLRFHAKPGDAKPLDARRVRLAALHVPAGSAPSPFVAAGPFHARLTGYLKNPLKGTYGFKLVATGEATLKVNDKVALTLPADKDKGVEIELAKNYNRIEIAITGPATGDAGLRLYWSGEKFDFEPVPPDVLYSRDDDADLVAKTHERDGRLLFANLHCASCHAVAPKVSLKPAMPEWKSEAPKLDNAGQRFNTDWLAAWILNPRALRPEATMPAVLHGVDSEQAAADIAAYLVSVKTGDALKPIGKAGEGEGEALFRRLACNSCHRLDEPAAKDELGRLSLHHVSAKFTGHALAHFLKSPHERYPWTRMPDFKLTDAEVGQLESYLRSQAKGTTPAKHQGDAKRGHKLYAETGCVRCHGDPTGKPLDALPLVNLAAFDKGCLAEKDHTKAPNFGLAEPQRVALVAFLKTDRRSLLRDTAAEFSLRQVQHLQCNACHRRDGEITRWHAVLEDEGKEPEKLPSLTWIGEKLKPEYSQKFIAGLHDSRARPWIKARMPAFAARAELLALGLSHEHGFGANEDERPKPDAKLAEIGEKLIPQQGGFNCNNCHGIGKTPAIQPFEAPGINLTDAALRLRHHYYQRWMLTPDRIDVTMRMPIFATDGKTTQIREVLDGDARHQFNAIWHYMQTLPGKK